MSDNKSSDAGQAGHEPAAAGSSGTAGGPGSMPPASTPRPSDVSAEAAPGHEASAAERASTDAPASASTVEPVDTAAAQRADAAAARAQARESAARVTAARERAAASHEPLGARS